MTQELDPAETEAAPSPPVGTPIAAAPPRANRAALVLASASGAAAGMIAAALLNSFWQLPDPVVTAAITALESKVAAAAPLTAVADVSKRLGATDAAVAASGKSAAAAGAQANEAGVRAAEAANAAHSLQSGMEALRAEMKTESQRRAEIAGAQSATGAEAPPAAPPPSVDVASADLAPLQARLAAVEAALQTATAQTEAAKTSARIAVAPSADTGASAAALAVVAQALTQALDRSSGYGDELAAAANLGADSLLLDKLRPFASTGLPQPGALAAQFAGLAQTAAAAAPAPAPESAPPPQGWSGWLFSGGARLVKVTPPQDAANANTRRAADRFAAALAQDDSAAALAALPTLPEPLRAAAASVADGVKVRSEAQGAARAILAAAIAALRKPKS